MAKDPARSAALRKLALAKALARVAQRRGANRQAFLAGQAKGRALFAARMAAGRAKGRAIALANRKKKLLARANNPNTKTTTHAKAKTTKAMHHRGRVRSVRATRRTASVNSHTKKLIALPTSINLHPVGKSLKTTRQHITTAGQITKKLKKGHSDRVLMLNIKMLVSGGMSHDQALHTAEAAAKKPTRLKKF